MKQTPNGLRLSASDLSNHLSCSHLTHLDLGVSQGRLSKPEWQDPSLAVLAERGREHEKSYVDHFRESGRKIVDLSDLKDDQEAQAKTLAAMKAGADVIVQAVLAHENWFGKADLLHKVPKESSLAGWSYEVTDTKLASTTRAGTILQLCLYSDLLEKVQGLFPEHMHVVTPGEPFTLEAYRTADCLAYYRLVKGRLEQTIAASKDESEASTYPEPVSHCDVCRWWQTCDKRRREDDHLSYVAGISTLQTRELQAISVDTLTKLAKHPLPFNEKFKRGSKESFEKVHEQARVQLAGREQKKPIHELLPFEPGRGLALLPEPSPGDLFFDIEGDPFAGKAGMEYLFGVSYLGKDGKPDYEYRWAYSATEEKALFEWFMDLLVQREKSHPGFHVYHYAPYEPSAIKRLMGRYGTREADVDRMLRAGVFVDLYAVVRQSLRASVERYSIKDLEQFFGFKRAADLRDASQARHTLEHCLELGRTEDISAEMKETVRVYNEDDCLAALELRKWLEQLRAQALTQGAAIERPAPRSGDASEEVSEAEQAVAELKARLIAGVPDDPEQRSAEQQARWILAELLSWHRRELNVAYWEKFRLRELGVEELLEEKAGLSGLEFIEAVGGTAKCPVHRYRFPHQETEIDEGDKLYSGEQDIGSVEALDKTNRTFDIKKTSKAKDLHPSAVFTHLVIPTPAQSASLFRIGTWVAEHGIDAPGPYRAARDLLLRLPPRLKGATLFDQVATTLKLACRLGLALDQTVLAIQGPPGAGKTHTAARMICELVKNGKRVGITAGSHPVIRNLLEGVLKAARETGTPVSCIQKPKAISEKETPGIRETTSNEEVAEALADRSAQIAAGTTWLWSREDMADTVDVLFIDEAGQLSLANALSVSQAAKSVVLLGDPQQLEQPLQGSHPDGTEVSALEQVLGDHKTIPLNRGLFLPETFRLHPKICHFTSEIFYEGRLSSHPGRERQEIHGKSPFGGSGLWYVPVTHDGNQSSSPEEADQVAQLVRHLTTSGLTWTDENGKSEPLTLDQILIVAPYNAQVALLSERLPKAKIGTVDKFQGQEAAVVIYSMTSSSPEDAPRGMEFLYSPNRLNVATSRAKAACILVGTQKLFEPDCKSPRQIQLANAFCRYLELAKTVPPATSGGKAEPARAKKAVTLVE